jgi:hypothetical protein
MVRSCNHTCLRHDHSFFISIQTSHFLHPASCTVPSPPLTAFATTGLVLTSIIFLLIMLQSYITCTYVMEACARAELLAMQANNELEEEQPPLSVFDAAALVAKEDARTWQASQQFHPVGLEDLTTMPITEDTLEDKSGSSGDGAAAKEDDEKEAPTEDPDKSDDVQEKGESTTPVDILETTESTAGSTMWWYKRTYAAGEAQGEGKSSEKKKAPSLPTIRDRKFELPELSRIFLGETWRIIFTATTCLDLYGLTWSVASVFAASLASEFSIRDNQDDYGIFIIFFLVIVVVMSFFSIVELLYVQLAFFVGRLIMVAMMLITTSVALNTSVAHFGEQEGPQRNSPMADFGTLHL